MTPHISGTSLSAQARYVAGMPLPALPFILHCLFTAFPFAGVIFRSFLSPPYIFSEPVTFALSERTP